MEPFQALFQGRKVFVSLKRVRGTGNGGGMFSFAWDSVFNLTLDGLGLPSLS